MPSRPPSTTRLTAITQQLTSAIVGAPHCPPGSAGRVRLYSLSDRRRTTEVDHRRDLDDLEELIGFTAPDTWDGVAILVRATAADVTAGSDGVGRADRASGVDGEDILLSVAVDRSGDGAASWLPARSARPRSSTGAISGTAADLLRRTLGLPCPPERRGSEALIISDWLSALLDAVADPATARANRRWSDAVALHPLAGERGSRHDAPGPNELAAITFAASLRCDWPALQALAAGGRLRIDGLAPHHASWMDAGCFARWMLGVHRPVTELLDDLSLFIDGPVLSAVESTVRAVDWLGFVPNNTSHSHPGDR